MLMKKGFIVLSACALLMAVAGCTREYDDRTLSERVKKLEEDVSALQTQVAFMNSQIDGVTITISEWKKGGFIEKVQEISGGYTITFVGGRTVTIYHGKDGKNGSNGKDGKDGHSPVVTIGPNGNWYIDGKDSGKPSQGVQGEQGDPGDPGADGYTPVITIGPNGNWFIDGEDTGITAKGQDGEDGEDGKDGEDGADGADGISPTIVNQGGELYWALDGELILVDGQPVPATVAPTFSVSPDGHLIMTVGGKETDLGLVRGASGDSLFKDIKADDECVTFTLADDSTIVIPLAKAFKLVIESSRIEALDGQILHIPYEVKNADASTVVDAFAGGLYEVEVDSKNSQFIVQVPDPFVKGQVLVWAQNDQGLSSIIKLSFTLKGTVEIITENIDKVAWNAGLLDVEVTSNMPVEVEKPTVDWLILKEVKSYAYTVTFELTDNDTEEFRSTEVNIVRADNKQLIQTITIGQLCQVIPGRHIFDFNKQGYETGQAVESLTVDGVTVSFNQSTGSEKPSYDFSNSSVCVNSANTLVVSAPGEIIEKIDFVMGKNDGTSPVGSTGGAMDQGAMIWTKSADTDKVTFSFSDIRRIAKIYVFLAVS